MSSFLSDSQTTNCVLEEVRGLVERTEMIQNCFGNSMTNQTLKFARFIDRNSVEMFMFFLVMP